MLSLWEVLKASKGLPASDGFTALFAKSLTGIVSEISGIPPLNLGKVKDVVDYALYGNTVQNGSPTPDNPVEVQAVGDRTGNLFNGEIQQGSLYDSNGSLVDSSTRVRTTKISMSEGTTYTVSSNLMPRNIIAYKNDVFVAQVYNGSASHNTSVSFTVPAGANQIAVAFKGNQAGNIGITPNDLEWLMINEGTGPLPYEPYGYKISVETKGKNLFDKDNTEDIIDKCYINQSGEIVSNQNGWYISNLIAVDSGSKYTYRFNMANDKLWSVPTIGFYDNQGVLMQAVTHSPWINYLSFDVPENVKYVRVSVPKSLNHETQLELGTTATEYEPYHEPITTTVYLNKPLYKIGDYADSINYAEKKAERVIKEFVLTGDNIFNTYSTADGSLAYSFNLVGSIDVESKYIANIICTHYVTYSQASIYANATTSGISARVNQNCLIYDSRFSTMTDLIAYLAEQYANGTPVKIYYVLATPETESVTLPKILTLDGTTVIDVETEIEPSNMNVKYKSRR